MSYKASDGLNGWTEVMRREPKTANSLSPPGCTAAKGAAESKAAADEVTVTTEEAAAATVIWVTRQEGILRNEHSSHQNLIGFFLVSVHDEDQNT